MNKPPFRFLALCSRLTLAGVLLCANGLATAANEKQQLNSVRNQLQSLQKEVQSAQSKRESATHSLQASEKAIDALKRKLLDLEQQHNDTRQQLDSLARQQTQLGKNLQRQQRQLERLLVVAQQHPAPAPLALLIQPQDPNQLQRELYWLGQLSEARAELLRGIRDNQTQLKSNSDRIAQQEQTLQQIVAARQTEKQQLESQQQAKKQALDQLNSQIQTKQEQIARLKQDEAHLTSVLEALQRASRKRAEEAARQRRKEPTARAIVTPHIQGRLGSPLKVELLFRFGATRPDTGTAWKGIFLRAPANQPVHAVAAGQVVFADWMRGFGNLIIIDHGNGLMSLYGNADSLLKHVGQTVKQGDNIALTGNSGGGLRQTGLYFEIRVQGQAVDPLRWISL